MQRRSGDSDEVSIPCPGSPGCVQSAALALRPAIAASETGHWPTSLRSSLELNCGWAAFSVGSGRERSLEEEGPTGKLPWSWMWLRDDLMSGMESASAQSQSKRPFFVGSLGIAYISSEGGGERDGGEVTS